jgi:hypothetical protein
VLGQGCCCVAATPGAMLLLTVVQDRYSCYLMCYCFVLCWYTIRWNGLKAEAEEQRRGVTGQCGTVQLQSSDLDVTYAAFLIT